VRIVALLRWEDSLAERLARSGWEVNDLDFGRMGAIGDFSDLEVARVAAERDLPSGVPVTQAGCGFVVGHHGVAPEPGGRFPAYVLWPDGEERLVETAVELAAALRDRLAWSCDRASELGLDVEAGREAALRAIDALAAGGELTIEALGPVFEVKCSARVLPLAHLRWDGFRQGWESPDGPPAEQRHHPSYIDYGVDGVFTEVWRDGLRAGAAAARAHLTAGERGALAPRPTEEQLRDRWIEDPEVRAWAQAVHADVSAQLREVLTLLRHGDDGAARVQLSAMQERLAAVIHQADTDERPAAVKVARSMRRMAAHSQRLADELAGARDH
jgi:hypothetical protein